MAGSAVATAGGRLKERTVQAAARVLEANPADIRLTGGRAAVAGMPERSISLGELACVTASGRGPLMLPDGPDLEATSYFAPPGTTYASGAHAAVVEVDRDSGATRILRYVVAHDCGRALQRVAVEGQIVGGVAQGIGGALSEALLCDKEGQPLTASLMDYALPRAAGVPSVEVEHMETLSALNPLGARGAGEGGTIPTYAVVAGAIEDALAPLGIIIDAVPVTPLMIRRAIVERSLPRMT